MFHRSIFIEIWGAKNCGFGRLALFILNGHYKSTHCYRPHPYFQTRPVPSNWYLSFSAVATIHSRISAGQACKPQSYAILNYTNRQIVVVDTSIAEKDFKSAISSYILEYLSACSSEIVSASDYQWKQDKQLLLCRSHQSRFSIFFSFNQHL